MNIASACSIPDLTVPHLCRQTRSQEPITKNIIISLGVLGSFEDLKHLETVRPQLKSWSLEDHKTPVAADRNARTRLLVIVEALRCAGLSRGNYELHADSLERAIKLRTWLCSRREPEVSRDVKLERLEGRNSNVSSPALKIQKCIAVHKRWLCLRHHVAWRCKWICMIHALRSCPLQH
jgi:hypothetical protein